MFSIVTGFRKEGKNLKTLSSSFALHLKTLLSDQLQLIRCSYAIIVYPNHTTKLNFDTLN